MNPLRELIQHELSFRVRTIDYRFWLRMSLAFVILLIVPFDFNYYEAIQPAPALPYYTVYLETMLFRYYDYRGYNDPTWSFMEIGTLVAAIVVCIPAFYLNHSFRNRQRDSSIRDISLLAIFSTAVLAEYLADYFPPYDPVWLIVPNPPWELKYFGTLVILFLVILPVFARESSLLGTERRNTEFPARRFTIFGCLWGLVALLIPYALVTEQNVNWIWFTVLSPVFTIMTGFSPPRTPWQPIDAIIYNYYIPYGVTIISTFVVSGLYLCFAFFSIRYLRGLVPKRRLVLLGLSGVLVPLLLEYQYAFFQEPERVVIPLPIVFLVAMILIAISNPIRRDAVAFEGAADTIGDVRLAPTDESDRIQISVADYVRLKIRSILHRNRTDSSS